MGAHTRQGAPMPNLGNTSHGGRPAPHPRQRARSLALRASGLSTAPHPDPHPATPQNTTPPTQPSPLTNKPAADRSAAGKKGEVPIMKDIENIVLPDEAPETDAMEQRLIVDGGYETGLDTTYLDTISDQDANEADLIDQATVVPAPEDFE